MPAFSCEIKPGAQHSVDMQTVAGTKNEHNARSSGLQDALHFRTQTSRRAMEEETSGLLKLCAVDGGGEGWKELFDLATYTSWSNSAKGFIFVNDQVELSFIIQNSFFSRAFHESSHSLRTRGAESVTEDSEKMTSH